MGIFTGFFGTGARHATVLTSGRQPGYGRTPDLQNGPDPGPEVELVPSTTDWGSPPAHDEFIFEHWREGAAGGPTLEIDPHAERTLFERQNLAYPHKARAAMLNENDDQLHGVGVPPGAPNDQPFQSGHTSIIIHNPSSEQGWGNDPAFRWARYPHMGNNFSGYGAGSHRRNGQYFEPRGNGKYLRSDVHRFSQAERDLALRHAVAHRVFGAVVPMSPYISYTQASTPAQPPAPHAVDVGAEGVTPW